MDNGRSDSDEIKFLKALFGENFEPGKPSTVSSNQQQHEESTNIPQSWIELENSTDIPDLHSRLIQHFSVLTDTEECQTILSDIINNVKKVTIENNRLVVSLNTHSGKMAKLVCSLPAVECPSDIPASYTEILQLHNGISFPDFGNAAFEEQYSGLQPVFLNGGEVFTMFEADTPEEEELCVVIDTDQGWFVIDPSIELSINRPAVSFLSHGSSKIQNKSAEFSIGGHFLRLIAQSVLGKRDKRLQMLSAL